MQRERFLFGKRSARKISSLVNGSCYPSVTMRVMSLFSKLYPDFEQTGSFINSNVILHSKYSGIDGSSNDFFFSSIWVFISSSNYFLYKEFLLSPIISNNYRVFCLVCSNFSSSSFLSIIYSTFLLLMSLSFNYSFHLTSFSISSASEKNWIPFLTSFGSFLFIPRIT